MRHCKLALLSSSILAAAAVNGSAFAQTDAASASVAEVVVTGTRLSAGGFTAPTPVTVVGAEAIAQRSPTTILDLINELPAFRATAGVSQQQRIVATGAGAQSVVDLRGLGGSRTLVLVDGRRFVGSNATGTVDTALIPSGLIERFEVVTGGASAAYGSDAVAGVTNFILKDKLTGIQGNIVAGRSSRGDNEEIGFGLAGGMGFAGGRGRVIAGGEYSRNDGVGTIYERGWSSIEPGNSAATIAFGATRPAGMPAQGFLPNVEYSTLTKGSVINTAGPLRGVAFNADGTPYTLQYGTVYGTLMAGTSSNYGAGPLSNWSLKTPIKRGSAMGRLTFDLTNKVAAFGEFSYGSAAIRNFSSFHQTPALIVLRNNPFLPVPIAARMDAAGLDRITLGRLDTDWGGLASDAEWATTRVVAGLKGEFADNWRWDSYVQYGKTHQVSDVTGSRESNILAAEYVVAGPTGPVCGPTATNPNFAVANRTAIIDPSLVLAGCVPFNPFGYGANSKMAIDYVSGIEHTVTDLEQTVAAFNVTGKPLSTWAGPVSLAIGAEYRLDKLDQVADPLQILGIYSFGNNKSFGGKNTVKEAYAEVGVPLAVDMAFAKILEINGAVRRTDYKTSGAVTTWKVGGNYEPFAGLRFRATRSRDIRAPNLNELFSLGGSSASTTFFNPFTGVAARLPTLTSGNPNLRPEIADTFTAGVVMQAPSQWAVVSGLRLSVDYYKIEIGDVIQSVGGDVIVNRCFQGFADYCTAIDRDSSAFGIRLVRTGPFNQSQLNTTGVDMEASYRVPLASLKAPGALDLRVLATWVDDLETIDSTGLIRNDRAGQIRDGGVPEWSWNVAATYRLKGFSGGLQARWVSAVAYDNALKGPDDAGYNPALANSININTFPSIVYLSGNLSYDIIRNEGRRLQLYGTGSNLFNHEPPALALAALASGGNPYDLVGRSFKIGLRFEY